MVAVVGRCGQQMRGPLRNAHPPPPPPPTLQEFKQLEDAAFKVLEAVERTKGELGAKEGTLAAIRAEFEQKKKEVAIIRQVSRELGGRGGGGGGMRDLGCVAVFHKRLHLDPLHPPPHTHPPPHPTPPAPG